MKMIDVESDNAPQNPYDNEHAILKKLQHPNIIKVYETFTHNESLCIVMEYCENGNKFYFNPLKEAIQSHIFSIEVPGHFLSVVCPENH